MGVTLTMSRNFNGIRGIILLLLYSIGLITNTIKSLDLLPLSIWEWVEENNCTKEATRGIMGNGKKGRRNGHRCSTEESYKVNEGNDPEECTRYWDGDDDGSER